MLKRAAVLSSEDEARQLERELLPLRDREREIQEQIRAATRALGQCADAPAYIIGAPGKSRAEIEEKDKKRTAAEMSRVRAEKDLLTLLPSLKSKSTRLREVLTKIEADRLERCRNVVAEAVPAELEATLGSRESRLNELRGQLSQVEKELHRVMTEQSFTQSTEDRARAPLETGEFPSQVTLPDQSTKSRELDSQRKVLVEAIRLQEKAVREARRDLAHETAKRLRPAMGDVVRRIGEGYAAARAATLEADRIRYAFSQATGGADESLPCFMFAAVPVPLIDVKDQFGFWLDDMRAQGYEV